MPFTFSHPAIVLPLGLLPKRYVSVTALVAGSIAPDFEYFLRLQIDSEYSHTIAGMFWFDLPLAMMLAFLFHLFVRNTLIENLPGWFRSRLHVFTHFDWTAHYRKHIAAVLISLIAGIASHLFWDAFTHQHGYFVDRISFLQQAVHQFGYRIAVYHLFQHSCTVIGALVILYAVARLPRQVLPAARFSIGYYAAFFLFTALVILAGYIAGKDYFIYGELIVTGIAGGLLGLLISGIYATFKHRRSRS